MKLVSIEPSSRKNKRMAATFRYPDGKERTYHFGADSAETYIDHGDEDRRSRYRSRFTRATGYDPDTPMALAYHILWGDSKSLRKNIASFRKRFNL